MVQEATLFDFMTRFPKKEIFFLSGNNTNTKNVTTPLHIELENVLKNKSKLKKILKFRIIIKV